MNLPSLATNHIDIIQPEVKISPIKVPTGAKQIGNYILGKLLLN